MKIWKVLCSFVLAVCYFPLAVAAASPEGVWTSLDDSTGAKRAEIRLSVSGSTLNGSVVKIYPQPGDRGICVNCPGAFKDKKVQAVTNLTNNLLKRTNKKVHTITNDNGPEFNHSKGAIAPVYYCHPGRPQERGTVENTIGLLRQYLKRKTNMAKLNYKQFQHIEDNINHRPRKCLDYKTPYEVFYGKSVALAI